MSIHQYIDRHSGAVVTEEFFGDRIVRFLYSTVRERAPALFRIATSQQVSDLVAMLSFDLPLAPRLVGNLRFLRNCGVDLDECLDPLEDLDTPRKIFERRIRYWECRPMPDSPDIVVAPSDARALVGTLQPTTAVHVKQTFFTVTELLGAPGRQASARFVSGDYAVFRLTPDKYHRNHMPVSGRIATMYELPGYLHACNPSALIELATPHSKNRRTVTLIDSDVAGGSGIGLVAMVEVAALMIGAIEQGYSARRYDTPVPLTPGMFAERGAPKSLFRPGSSTVVLLFEPGRVRFDQALIANRERTEVKSRFTAAMGAPVVETDVVVRSAIAAAVPQSREQSCPTNS
ncbi:MAG: phosphatidylserine decarboxylase [Myxococcota bacterium]